MDSTKKQQVNSESFARIKVIGVGGGGSNAVNRRQPCASAWVTSSPVA